MNLPIVPPGTNPLTNPLLARVRDRMPGETYTLPSGGVFYNNGELREDCEGNCEVHVFPMTIIDEIVLKTPDMLYSGQAVREVFARCIPQVLNTDQMLAKDIDFLLLCLRKVSYGDEVELEAMHEGCKAENPKLHTYRVSVNGFIKASKRIDPTTIDQTYTVNLPNDQEVKVIPIRYLDYIKTMQVEDQNTDIPIPQQVKIFADALSGVIQSVDEITDRAMISEWLGALSPEYITMLTDKMGEGAMWGPDYVQETKCQDCGETMKLVAPMNPLIFFS